MAEVIEAVTKNAIKAPTAVEAVTAAVEAVTAAACCASGACCAAGAAAGPLQALGRLFALGRHEQQQQLSTDELQTVFARQLDDEELVFEEPDSCGILLVAQSGGSALVDLVGQGPYLLAAAFLDASSLCCADAACRPLRDLHRANGGAWSDLGTHAFHGLDLEGEGLFECGEPLLQAKHSRVDWKGRYARFLSEVCTFREPFSGSEITQVSEADEIAYCRMKLCTDVLAAAPSRAVYIEVEVLANPDNVSLAVVNFDAGGCSSVTFSPDTGAVIRERKVCEEPRKVQGAYIQPLMTITQGQGFEGCMGLYLCNGQLAFFRRHLTATADNSEPELGPWESTGFITDLEWAEGKQLTPCLAFRDEGAYHVRASRVSEFPPVLPERTAMAYDESNWSDLNWDADQEFADAEI